MLNIENDDERSFYEKECVNSNWSVRKPKRQLETSLFGRLLLSEGKDHIMKNIYLISCTKEKQKYRCKAEEMYMPSSLFKASYNYALNHVLDKDKEIFILSAKHHLLNLTDVIDPYDKTLKDMSKEEKEKWAEIVYNRMNDLFDIENTNFIFLAGNNYIRPLEKYLNVENCLNPIPIQSRSIGRRKKWLKENIEIKKYQVSAKVLRNREEIFKVPNNLPGWYKWWVPEEMLGIILNSPYINNEYLKTISPYLTTKKIDNRNYYYIYVGVAIKGSIRSRLDWHINQKHSKSSVKSGFLSTLRQSISSLVCGNQYNEEETNNFIDNLIIEYYPINLKIKSKEAKEKIEAIEKQEINKNVLPLNIRDNKNNVLKEYLKELNNVRKKSK